MDTHDVMERRRKATAQRGGHWNGKPSTTDQTAAPDFGALIPVDTAERFPVPARKLHAALGPGREFNAWITGRIAKLDFQINRDFRKFSQSGEGPVPVQEYALTLDMAKHLCMLERTSAGHQVREYFIDCEKRLLAQPSNEAEAARIAALPKSALLMMAAQQAEEVERLQARNAALEPKAEALDVLSAGENSITLQKAGNELGLGRTTFINAMKARDILQANGQPYRRHLDAGRFEVKPTSIWRGDRQETYSQVFVTQKGKAWLANVLRDLLPAVHQASIPGVGGPPGMLN